MDNTHHPPPDDQQDVLLGAQRYGPQFPREYDRQRACASHHVALNAAALACGRLPHEVERRTRECTRYARERGLAWPRVESRLKVTRGSSRRHGSGRPAARRTTARASATSGDSGSDGPGDSDDGPPGRSDVHLTNAARSLAAILSAREPHSAWTVEVAP